jgi:hypothetical protein
MIVKDRHSKTRPNHVAHRAEFPMPDRLKLAALLSVPMLLAFVVAIATATGSKSAARAQTRAQSVAIERTLASAAIPTHLAQESK